MQPAVKESPVEQWYRLRGFAMPDVKNRDELKHFMKQSKYPVERAFNGLSSEERDLLKAIADIEKNEDLIKPALSGDKLSHYNNKGIDKLFKAMLDIVCLRRKFPDAVSRRDFYQRDPAVCEV